MGTPAKVPKPVRKPVLTAHVTAVGVNDEKVCGEARSDNNNSKL